MIKAWTVALRDIQLLVVALSREFSLETAAENFLFGVSRVTFE